jgi:hypothetical protein
MGPTKDSDRSKAKRIVVRTTMEVIILKICFNCIPPSTLRYAMRYPKFSFFPQFYTHFSTLNIRATCPVHIVLDFIASRTVKQRILSIMFKTRFSFLMRCLQKGKRKIELLVICLHILFLKLFDECESLCLEIALNVVHIDTVTYVLHEGSSQIQFCIYFLKYKVSIISI